jgi:hypothetical protein
MQSPVAGRLDGGIFIALMKILCQIALGIQSRHAA